MTLLLLSTEYLCGIEIFAAITIVAIVSFYLFDWTTFRQVNKIVQEVFQRKRKKFEPKISYLTPFFLFHLNVSIKHGGCLLHADLLQSISQSKTNPWKLTEVTFYFVIDN